MTKDIKDNIFAVITADDDLTLTDKAKTLAAVLKTPQGQQAFEEFTDHLMACFKQSTQDVFAALEPSVYSLSRDFMIAAQAACEAPQDPTNMAGASSKVLAALHKKGESLNNLLSTNCDLQGAYDVLSSALLRAHKLDTFGELKVITKQLGQQFDNLLTFKDSNDDLIRDVCSMAAGVTSFRGVATKAPATKNQM